MRRRVDDLWPVFGVGVVFLSAWEVIVNVFDIKEFLLPKPSSIWLALRSDWPALWEAGLQTGTTAVVGLAIGIVGGVTLALAISRFGWLSGSLTPLAVAANATPIIALAPIFNAWFGLTDPRSNQAVVVAVVFFPVFINTVRGLGEVDDHHLELMRSLAASEWTILRRVRVPNSLPFFLTSLRLAAPLSVIAAIVAEYFGGPQSRIGPYITQNASFARYDQAWSAIVVASAIGLVLFGMALLTERISMPWKLDSTIR